VSHEFDITAPNPARMWNYWLGGTDNFPADRAVGDRVIDALPTMPLVARGARRFLTDAVTLLATEYGVRQFIDIWSRSGSGGAEPAAAPTPPRPASSATSASPENPDQTRRKTSKEKRRWGRPDISGRPPRSALSGVI